MCIINNIAGRSAYHILIHSKQPRKSKLFACIYIQYFIIQKSLLCFSPSYLYIALCCCCMFWFFNNVSQAVMDNIWYSSATLAAALKMSLRHYHISLRAGILPWFCTSESLFFAMPALSSFPCLPHPFNLCWELRPSHALTPPPSKKKTKKPQHIWSDWFLNKGFKMMQLLWLDVAFVIDADASALLLASHVSYPAKKEGRSCN